MWYTGCCIVGTLGLLGILQLWLIMPSISVNSSHIFLNWNIFLDLFLYFLVSSLNGTWSNVNLEPYFSETREKWDYQYDETIILFSRAREGSSLGLDQVNIPSRISISINWNSWTRLLKLSPSCPFPLPPILSSWYLAILKSSHRILGRVNFLLIAFNSFEKGLHSLVLGP